jgi:lipopolysaccharide assembly protein A
MNKLWSLIKWVLKAAIFFVLFAFALNNQHDVQVHIAFGRLWQAPLVLVILVTFALGLAVGALAMGWTLRQRRKQLSSQGKNRVENGV